MRDLETRKTLAAGWGYKQFVYTNPYVTDEIKKENPGSNFKEDYYYIEGDVPEDMLEYFADRHPFDRYATMEADKVYQLTIGTREGFTNKLKMWHEIKKENR